MMRCVELFFILTFSLTHQTVRSQLLRDKLMCETCHWPMRGSASRSNRVDDIFGPVELIEPEWTFKTDARIGSQPLVDQHGDIYFGSADKGIYSVHSNGTVKWKRWTRRATIGSGAITNDGTMYVGTWDSEFYALNTTTGSIRWKYNTGKYITSSPLIGKDATVIVGCGDGKIYAFSPTGSVVWTFDTKKAIVSSPVFSKDSRTFYIGSGDGSVYAIDSYHGHMIWNTSTEGAILASPALSNEGDVLYITNLEASLVAIDRIKGTILWTFKADRDIPGSPAVTMSGEILFGSWDKKLYKIRPDGTLMWKTDDINVIESTPLIDAADRIYIGTWGGFMRVIRGCDGKVISEYYNSNGVSTTATLNNATGSLIYGGGDGILRSFAPTCSWERDDFEEEEIGFLEKKKNRVRVSCKNNAVRRASQSCNVNAEAYERFIEMKKQDDPSSTSSYLCTSCPRSVKSMDAQHTGKSRFGIPRFFPKSIVRGFENKSDFTFSALSERQRDNIRKAEETQRVRTDAMETWGIMNNKAYWATRRANRYERVSTQWQEVADEARGALAMIAANHAEPRTLRNDQLRSLERLLRGELEVCARKDKACEHMNRRWKNSIVKLVEDSIKNETERLRVEEEQYEIDLRVRMKREGRERIAERNARLLEEEALRVEKDEHEVDEDESSHCNENEVNENGVIGKSDEQKQQNIKDLICTEISDRKHCQVRGEECMWRHSRCLYKNSGCTDMKACNYNERAIYDDASCVYPERNRDCDGNCIDEDENGVCDVNEEEEEEELSNGNMLPANLAFMAYRATELERDAKHNATKFREANKKQITDRDTYAHENNLTLQGSYIVSHPNLEVDARDVVRWLYDANETIYGTMSMDSHHNIFVGTKSGKMLAIDGHVGKLKWSFQTASTIVSTPAITNQGTILFGSWDGHIYAVDCSNGALRWKYRTNGAISASPVIGNSNDVYVGSGDGVMYALSVTNGMLKWKHDLSSGALHSSPALSSDGKTLFVASVTGSLFALSSQGNTLWSVSLGTSKVESSPVLSTELELLYIGTYEGKLHAIHVSNGTTLWSNTTKDEKPIVSTPAFSNTKRIVYVVSKGSNVYALDAYSGKHVWITNTGQPADASLILDRGDHLTFGSLQGVLMSLKGDTGHLQFALTLPPGSKFYSSVIIPRDGALLFVTHEGKFYFVERMYPYL